MILEIAVKLDTIEKSNDFLLALWDEIQNEFGKCAWQYSPYKDGKRQFISFGNMDIGIEENISVGITYKKKGCIEDILFTFDQSNNGENLADRLKILVSDAKNRIGDKTISTFRIPFFSIHGLMANYDGERFKIYKSKKQVNNIIELSISGYGRNDKIASISTNLNLILNLFSSFTNSVFITDQNLENEVDSINNNELKNIYNDDPDFLDGISILDGEILLPKKATSLVDRLLKNELLRADKICLDSSNLYHSGRKIDAQIMDLMRYGELEEIGDNSFQFKLEERNEILTQSRKLNLLNSEMSTVLYISALEVAASITEFEKSRCKECGQLKYGISKRVYEFVSSNINEHIAKFIKDKYNERSSFVHTGKLMSNYSYSGNSLPQLSSSSSNGCLTRIQSPDINLREFTSFLIRNLIEE